MAGKPAPPASCGCDAHCHSASRDMAFSFETLKNAKSAKFVPKHSNSLRRMGGRIIVSMGGQQIFFDTEQNGWLQFARLQMHHLLENKCFQSFIALIVLLNCTTVGIELQQGMPPGLIGTIFAIAEYVFLTVYVFELLTRFFAYGLACLHDSWVQFDIVVVGGGVLESWILVPLNANMEGLGILVILRVLRLFRLARTFKLLIKFPEMAILIKGLMASAGIMIYTLILLFVMLFIFACAGRELVGRLPDTDPDLDPNVAELATRNFGTITVAMFTLIRFVTLDSVASIYEPIVHAKPLSAFYFMATILTISIMLMNLITAVMVNSSIEKAQEDKDVMRQAALEKQRRLTEELNKLFIKLDADSSGCVSLEEFEELPQEGLELLEQCVPEMDPFEIFHALDLDCSGSMTIDEFTDGLLGLLRPGNSPLHNRMFNQIEIMHKQMLDLHKGQMKLADRISSAGSSSTPTSSKIDHFRGSVEEMLLQIGRRVADDAGKLLTWTVETVQSDMLVLRVSLSATGMPVANIHAAMPYRRVEIDLGSGDMAM